MVRTVGCELNAHTPPIELFSGTSVILTRMDNGLQGGPISAEFSPGSAGFSRVILGFRGVLPGFPSGSKIIVFPLFCLSSGVRLEKTHFPHEFGLPEPAFAGGLSMAQKGV